MDPWVFARFHADHVRRRWCQRPHGERGAAVFGPVHRIAVAAFAPVAGTYERYLEWHWGHLNGEGVRVVVHPNGAVSTRRRLWIA